LARVKLTPVSEHAREHFLALAHRIQSMDRLFSNLSEDLSFAFEAGMLIEQSRQTDTTRKLSAWAAIIAIPTAVAGIYGMNFENMPELKWEYGYYGILGLMASACATLYALFRRAKWL
jgi:magnesium transporter